MSMAVALNTPPISTGTGESESVALPNWVADPAPQQATVRLLRIAQESAFPAAMAMTSVSPVTATGTLELAVLLFPSVPTAFAPQHTTVLSARRAQA